jgi:AraC family transcriptional regulator, transcriptional activator FtrA
MPPACALPDGAESGIIDTVHDDTANVAPTVAIVVFEGVTLFELAAANDVFGGTEVTTAAGGPLYRVLICGPAPSVTTDMRLRMEVPHGLDALASAHTVVVPPTLTPDEVPAQVLDALRLARSRGQRILSLCTGASVLAAAGILDGHTATTHWAECADLARRYPRVRVDPSVLYVDEGDLLTSAGSAASLDLCLHVVQRDYGTEVATQVARELVIPLHRAGGQAQYIETPVPEPGGDDLFADTISWLQANLDQEVTVADLAARAAMSPRTFARRFPASTGTTPLTWIVQERVRLAQRLLETTDLPVDVIASKSGFGTADNLRKHFGRILQTTPQSYRRTFQAPAPRRLTPDSPDSRKTPSGDTSGSGRLFGLQLLDHLERVVDVPADVGHRVEHVPDRALAVDHIGDPPGDQTEHRRHPVELADLAAPVGQERERQAVLAREARVLVGRV